MRKSYSASGIYVDNKKLYEDFCKWKEEDPEAKQMPKEIANAIIMIATELCKSGRFRGYSWNAEMRQDAIITCVKFPKNFNPEKSKNPFAFLSKICWNAIIRRITIEKEELYCISEYKDHISNLYDIPVDCEEEEEYNNIDNKAKQINRTFIKKMNRKSKKKVPKKLTINDFF